MGIKSCVLVTILLFLFYVFSLSTAGAAPVPKAKINITDILGKDPELSTFSSLLNKTGLAQEINTRQTITVLAVDNGAIGGLSSKSLDKIKAILSTHIILDYYDIAKLRQMSSKKNTTVTTMFQATGIATNQQGFLNIVALPNFGLDVVNKIRFGSAVKGAPVDIQLVSNTEFDYHKFDYVVLRVSGVIFTPGIDGWTPPPTAAPKKTPIVAPPPNKKTTPAPGPDDEDDYDTSEAGPPSEGPALSSPPVSGDAPSSTNDAADENNNNNNDTEGTGSPKSSATHFSPTSFFLTALVVVLASSFPAAAF